MTLFCSVVSCAVPNITTSSTCILQKPTTAVDRAPSVNPPPLTDPALLTTAAARLSRSDEAAPLNTEATIALLPSAQLAFSVPMARHQLAPPRGP